MARRKRKAQYKRTVRKRVRRSANSKKRAHPKTRKRPTRRGRKAFAYTSNPKRTKPRSHSDALLEIAVRQMNRGSSLTATARSLHVSAKDLKRSLKGKRLLKRRGKRWVPRDNRPRRVPVITGARVRIVTVSGYDQARLVGEHHHAVGEFVRTNAVELIEPFKGRSVQATDGRRYTLETRPNALHRIAAMDSPPFHEIYQITSQT